MLRALICVICFTLGGVAMAKSTDTVKDYKTVTQPRTTEENHRETPRVMYNFWLGDQVKAGRMTDEEAFRLFRQKYPDAGK